ELRFAGRNVEEQRIEPVDFRDEPSPLAVGFAGTVARRIVEGCVIPTLRGYLGNAVAAAFQVPPEFAQILRRGVFPTDADDGDFVAARFRRLQEAELAADRRGRTVPHSRLRRGLVMTAPTRLRTRLCADDLGKCLREITCQARDRLILEEQRLRERAEG